MWAGASSSPLSPTPTATSSGCSSPPADPLDRARPNPRLEHVRRHTPADADSPLGPGQGNPLDQLLDPVLPDHPGADGDGAGAGRDVEARELLSGQRAGLALGPARPFCHLTRVSNMC